MRSRLAFVLIAAITFFAAAPVSAQESADAPANTSPILLSETEYDWLIRTDAWLNLSWTAPAEVTNVRVTATSNDRAVKVEYPTNTADHSGPSQGGTLSENEIDHTALFIRTTWRAADVYTVDVTISYEVNGEAKSDQHVLTFNETMWEGDTFALVTETATVVAGDDTPGNGWIELDYIGIAPQLWDVRIVADSELGLIHPRGSYTSMHNEKSLRVGERDVARFYINPAQLAAGEDHTIVIETSYKTGDQDNTETERHEIVVSAVAAG